MRLSLQFRLPLCGIATGCGSSHPVDIHYVSDPESHRNFLNFVSYSLILFLLFAKLTYKHLAGLYPRSQKRAGHNYHFRYLRYPQSLAYKMRSSEL